MLLQSKGRPTYMEWIRITKEKKRKELWKYFPFSMDMGFIVLTFLNMCSRLVFSSIAFESNTT